jgi:hypothetical protein
LRGGVITGRVTDARGEPAAGVRVNLVRVRTPEGAPVREVNRFMGSLERSTDDRGVYRSYGLLPGAYLVSAGGGYSVNTFEVGAHADEAPTFYPSTTRDAASEVTVRAGEEAGAIDIRLRGDRGHAVSGTVEGVTEASHAEQATALNVVSAASTERLGQVYIYGRAESDGFAFDGLTDGDYDVVAERYSTKDWRRVASASRRVQVRGADVTGLRLTLAPLGSVSGRIVFEQPPAPDPKPSAADAKASCEGSADALWWGAAVVARREAAGEPPPANELSTLEAAPGERGEFTLGGVAAGTYRLDFNLPKGYFVTGVRVGQRAAGVAQAGARVPAATGTREPATGAAVVRVGRGEQVSGVVVTAAYGAASVAGRVSFPECEGCAPERVRLYLVPQERERADDALRYAEALVTRKGREGEFSFDAVAPGRYALLALPDAPEEKGRARQPAFASEDSRARLRRDAEARGARITLAPCQHEEGLAVVYAPPPAAVPGQNRER